MVPTELLSIYAGAVTTLSGYFLYSLHNRLEEAMKTVADLKSKSDVQDARLGNLSDIVKRDISEIKSDLRDLNAKMDEYIFGGKGK